MLFIAVEIESQTMKVYAVEHVQLAIPPNSENLARVFYGDILGLREKPKPEHFCFYLSLCLLELRK